MVTPMLEVCRKRRVDGLRGYAHDCSGGLCRSTHRQSLLHSGRGTTVRTALAPMSLGFLEEVDEPLDGDRRCAGLRLVRRSSAAVARCAGRTITGRPGIDDVDRNARTGRPRRVHVRRPRRAASHSHRAWRHARDPLRERICTSTAYPSPPSGPKTMCWT